MGQSAQKQIVSGEGFWTFSAGAFSLRASKDWLDDADDAISDLILRSKTSSTEPSYLSAHRCVPVSASTAAPFIGQEQLRRSFAARCGFKLSRPFRGHQIGAHGPRKVLQGLLAKIEELILDLVASLAIGVLR
jgi:hypothetical protein